MKTRLSHRFGLLMIGLLAASGSVLAQRFEVEVKFIEVRGSDRVAASNEDWSALAGRNGVRVLTTPQITTRNGEGAGLRLDSTATPGAGVQVSVTPTQARGGIRLEGHAAVTVQVAAGSGRQRSTPATETAASAFNRTILPGQSVTIHLGRRWEARTTRDQRWRGGRAHREDVPFDYYVCLSVDRVASRR